MRIKFSMTSNVRRFLSGVTALEERGAGEACLLVLSGAPGLGKTRAVDWWTVQNGGVLVEAMEGWTRSWMLRDMLKKLEPNLRPGHSAEQLLEQVRTSLAGRNQEMIARGKTFGVVIDEAEPVISSKSLLETIRKGLSDRLEIPFILVGMSKIRGDLASRALQASSRVGQYVDFKPITPEDVGVLVTDLCEVEVAPCLVEFLAKASRGYVREVKEGIRSVERFGKANPGRAVSIKSMHGQVLMNDRRTGRPILVRR